MGIIEEGNGYDLIAGKDYDDAINPSYHIKRKSDGKKVAGPYFGKAGYKEAKRKFDFLESQIKS